MTPIALCVPVPPVVMLPPNVRFPVKTTIAGQVRLRRGGRGCAGKAGEGCRRPTSLSARLGVGCECFEALGQLLVLELAPGLLMTLDKTMRHSHG